MKIPESVVRQIEKLLTEEITVCDAYLMLLRDEQAAVVALKPEKVAELASRRERLTQQLTELRSRRAQLVGAVTGAEGIKLSEVIASRCAVAADRKRIVALIEKLRGRVALLGSRSREFNQVLAVSLGLVNGSLSILWSATQTVTKSYNSFGTLTEQLQPTAPRQGSSLGRA